MEIMIRNVARKVMWVGRATVFLVGFAVIVAAILGLTTAALAGTGVGDTFNLGRLNTVNQLSRMVGSTDAPMLRVDNDSAGPNATALDLRVESRHAPMIVDSTTKVGNLNADKLDDRDASQIGVNGYELVRVQSTFDSTARKTVHARCPEGKVAVGGGAQVFPSLSDSRRNSAPIVLRYSTPNTLDDRDWTVIADEIQEYGFSWWVSANAICATAGVP